MQDTFALHPPTRTGRSHVAWVLLAGLAVAAAQVWFIDRSWQDCQVTRQVGYTSTQLFTLGVPALTLLNAAVIALPVMAYGRRRHDRATQAFLTTVAAIVLVLALSALLVLFVATPAGTSDMACAGGVPAWWPSWLPG